MYFSIATWLERSYVGRPEPGKRIVVEMCPQFEPLRGQAYRYLPNVRSKHKSLMALAEDPTNTHDCRSPIIIYEDDDPLGPAHSTFGNISKVGLGHFAHWTNQEFVFSTSDGGIPTTMGGVTGFETVRPPPFPGTDNPLQDQPSRPRKAL